jgi:hypothetical protein
MNYQLDQMFRYNGADYKIIGVLIEGSGNTSKIMIAINGKVTIIDCNEIK